MYEVDWGLTAQAVAILVVSGVFLSAVYRTLRSEAVPGRQPLHKRIMNLIPPTSRPTEAYGFSTNERDGIDPSDRLLEVLCGSGFIAIMGLLFSPLIACVVVYTVPDEWLDVTTNTLAAVYLVLSGPFWLMAAGRQGLRALIAPVAIVLLPIVMPIYLISLYRDPSKGK